MGKLRRLKASLQLSLMALLLIAIITVNLAINGRISIPVCASIFAIFSLISWILINYMTRALLAQKVELEKQLQERSSSLEYTTEKLQNAMDELSVHQQQVIYEETQKSLTSIVSGFGHEINNPLTGILGYVDLMELNDDLSPYSKKRLNGIKDQAIRIKEVIDQLNWLDPELEQVKSNIDLSNMLEKLVKIVSKQSENVEIETDLNDSKLIVRGNHFALWQVFEGILENALEAIKERGVINGRIKVMLRQAPDLQFAVAEFIDNGGGFESPEKAFNPFYTTKPRVSKRGIGLAIAYNVVQEHKGNIIIDNNDTGATVAVYLPLCLEETGEVNDILENTPESLLDSRENSTVYQEMKTQERIQHKKNDWRN